MQVPNGCPVSAFNPDGKSTARTGIECSLITSMIFAIGSRTSLCNPVPKIASTSRSHFATRKCDFFSASSVSMTLIFNSSFSAMSRLIRASPVNVSGDETRKISTSRPACASCRAMTKPSPPLFPFPTNMPIRCAFGKYCSILRTI